MELRNSAGLFSINTKMSVSARTYSCAMWKHLRGSVPAQVEWVCTTSLPIVQHKHIESIFERQPWFPQTSRKTAIKCLKYQVALKPLSLWKQSKAFPPWMKRCHLDARSSAPVYGERHHCDSPTHWRNSVIHKFARRTLRAAKLVGIMPSSQGEQCIKHEAQQHGYSSSKVQQEDEWKAVEKLQALQ